MHAADRTALDKLLKVDPEWYGMGLTSRLTGCKPNVLLHAGPPFVDPVQITRPILNSACVAAVYEKLAKNFDIARERILGGEIVLHAAQDYRVVTPLASVVSASMQLQIIRDRQQPDHAIYAPLNGGNGAAMRLGICDDATLSHLRWLNEELAGFLGVQLPEPVPLVAVAAKALRQGDDCHGRTPVATRILTERLAELYELNSNTRDFLDQGPSFFLNLWMAACKCMLMSAEGLAGSSLVIAAGGNGAQTGIKVAGLPDTWFTVKAAPPSGKFDDLDLPPTRALGAIGDSAIVDTLGFGAMAMNFAPEQQKSLQEFLPANGLSLPALLLSVMDSKFGDLEVRVGLLARTVVESNNLPVISLGILDIEGQLGRLGGGVYTPPKDLFIDALRVLDG